MMEATKDFDLVNIADKCIKCVLIFSCLSSVAPFVISSMMPQPRIVGNERLSTFLQPLVV